MEKNSVNPDCNDRIKRESVPLPQNCANPDCQTPIEELEFNWNQTHWRNKCKACEKHVQEETAKSKSLPTEFKCTEESCLKIKTIDNFEKTGSGGFRKICIECRRKKRKESVKSVSNNPSRSTPPPDAKLPKECIHCHGKPPEKQFVWRTDTKVPCYRALCIGCKQEQDAEKMRRHREKKKGEDYEGYRKQELETNEEWRKKNNYDPQRDNRFSKKIVIPGQDDD